MLRLISKLVNEVDSLNRFNSTYIYIYANDTVSPVFRVFSIQLVKSKKLELDASLKAKLNR